MFRFKCLSLAVVAAMSVLCATSASASSILIDQGAMTYDPATRLQWLDITKTQGLSYNDVLTNRSVDYVKNGWRFATDVDVDKLYRDAGLPIASNPNGAFFFSSNPNEPGYSALEHDAFVLGNELGWTLPSLPDYDTTAIFDIAPNPRNPATIGLTTLSILGYLSDVPDRSIGITEYLDTVDKDAYVRNIGSFLVRDVSVVPIPGQAVFFAAILLGLAGLNLRRRSRLS